MSFVSFISGKGVEWCILWVLQAKLPASPDLCRCMLAPLNAEMNSLFDVVPVVPRVEEQARKKIQKRRRRMLVSLKTQI